MSMQQQYDDEAFTIINDNNFKQIIPKFCEDIFRYNLSESGLYNLYDVQIYVKEIIKILQQLPRPYTIIQETFHIDPCFRDSYYIYYSNQHFQVKRYSRRISFIKKEITAENFFSNNMSLQKEIEDNFMGSCVINPLTAGIIGRTLIHPIYLLKDTQLPAYMCLSKFNLHIYGKKFTVNAFPFRMQDGETMRCTEVTILNVLEFYSNKSSDYKFITPGKILEIEEKQGYERVLPTKGTTYPILTKVLSEVGFSPKLYNLSSIVTPKFSNITQEEELRRYLHYYIESGIPVAVNLLPTHGKGTGHSIVCIGHGKKKEALRKKADEQKLITFKSDYSCHPLINSADFYEDYVVIDDNTPVYQVKNFTQLSSILNMRVTNIAVPLYKRMFLDAADAYEIATTILHHEKMGLNAWAEDFLNPEEDVVIRLFMTASYNLKRFRTQTLKNIYAKETYAIVPMPRFVWVCELYTLSNYDRDDYMAFGEIIIDATSSVGNGNAVRSLIMMHYPNVMAVRFPEQEENGFEEMIEFEEAEWFPGYRGNLFEIN